jgi:ribosomal protein S18 acetylase RimI-like enzyme
MKPFDLTLRTADCDDAAALASFAEHVFRDAFGPHNRAEDMDAYCSTAFSVEEQQRQLADRDHETVLAIACGELAGYAQLHAGPPPPCVTGPHPLELKRLYVDRRWHGRGVAQALMTHAMTVAQQRGAQTFYLSVWQYNHRAIAFYAKHGFVQVGSAPFVLGTDVQHDPVMMRPLPVTVAGPGTSSPECDCGPR